MTSNVRARLVGAAATLFGTKGVEGVTLREVNAAAGTGNASAVQYHFGDRLGLILALLDEHRPAVEARRHAMLDAYEGRGIDDIRDLVGAFVRPLASELGAAAGVGYLQVLADLANRPQAVLDPAVTGDASHMTSTNRWRLLIEPLMDPAAVRLHRRFMAMQFTFTELARRGRDRPLNDQRLFVSHLVDVVTGMISAPISPETERHILVTRSAPQIERARPNEDPINI